MHSSPYCHHRDHHWVVVMWDPSRRSVFVKKRSGSGDWSCSLAYTAIMSLEYFFRWEVVHPPPEKPPKMVLISPWTGISCPWSGAGVAGVGAPCFSCRYSFRKPFFTNSFNWCPSTKQLHKLWSKAWWNSHQVSLMGPRLLSVFGGDFSLFATLGIAISSLRSIQKLCLVGAPSLVRALVWGYLGSYGGCFARGFFFVVASCTLMGWGRPVPQGLVGPTLPRFSLTSFSVPMWATARRRISQNVFGRHLIRESLKGPDNTPRLNACTIMASSLVCSFTTSTPNRFRKSLKGSP